MSIALSSASSRPTSTAVAGNQRNSNDRPLGRKLDLEALHPIGSRMRFSRGETIYSEGDKAEQIYKIVSGSIRLCKYTVDGRRQIICFLMPGDFFGYTKLLDYDLAAEAVEDTLVLSYPRIQFERLEATVPDIESHVSALLSNQLRLLERQIVMLGRQSARERMASFLVDMATRAGSCSGDRLDLPMGRQDVGDYLGLTLWTVCRTLADLKRDRLIVIPNSQQVVLTDLDALTTLAEGMPGGRNVRRASSVSATAATPEMYALHGAV